MLMKSQYYNVRIVVEPCELPNTKGQIGRSVVVSQGGTDINEIVEDMINTLEKPL